MSSRLRIDPWWAGVGGLYVALAGVYAVLGLWRYSIFHAGVDDGIFTQVVGGLFDGFSSTEERGNHLLVHFSPILALAFPFVKLFHGAIGLIVLQAIVTAAVVFPVWGIASARLSKPLAFAVTIVAACYPPLSGEAVGDFHELAFAPALSGCLVWALDRRAWRWTIVVAMLLCCVKEDQFVALAFIGCFVALTSRSDGARRRCGLAIAALAVGFALSYFAILRPLIDPRFPYWSFHFYQWWWSPATPNGFVSWNSPIRLQYLLAALAPLAFVPLLSRRYAPLVLPGLAEVMLSHEAISFVIGLHYSATWSGYMLCAFADGAGALAVRSQRFATAALFAAIAISVWTSRFASPILPGYFLARLPNAQDRAEARVLSSLPPNAGVYGDGQLFAHLGTDPNAAVNMQGQEYLVFDLAGDGPLWQSEQTLITQRKYALVFEGDGLAILRRRPGWQP